MQTVYLDAPEIGREGLISHLMPTNIITRAVEASGGLKPGRFVTKGTNDKDARLPALTGEVSAAGLLLGVTALTAWASEPLTDGVYPQKAAIPILRKGWIWMIAEDAVDEGDAVFVRFTAGGGEELGRVRSDADGGDAVAAPSCFYRSSTDGANELVVVEVNLP